MPALKLFDVAKTFTMHLRGGIRLPVVSGVTFDVEPGQCVVLTGPSGSGKSSILKMIYGSYRCDHGQIFLRYQTSFVDIAAAEPRHLLTLRRRAIGYVSQFLRAVPRVPALDVVADSLGPTRGKDNRTRAAELLRRLNIPERLWSLPPATFSGGEQQRVNIARSFLHDMPVLLLDEPTASLDARNRELVVDLITEKKRRGIAIVAVVHDEDVREAIADSLVDVTLFAKAA
ncbi:MAG: phosphonate C-P lyase system protein PhnL [Rhizobiales bacterium]|nr:phosphonate C-P lyase system protein PhnL [Hyphomicrobiales bacterium]